ncbi:MAG: hypothetical protein IKM28_02205 [Lachnospiraceae bacterium]|nr:hypothetical protein [Lachnospiraceae bacterium]
MDNLLDDIYEKVLCYEKEMQKAEKRLELEVEKLLYPYKDIWNEDDIGTIRELIYAFQVKAIKEGIRQGMKLGIDLLRG